MICLLINYYWALYFGKKYTYIEINAKEWLENLYYSFVSVTGWVGRQGSHLKHPLAGWQNATEARWKPLVDEGGHGPPQGWKTQQFFVVLLPWILARVLFLPHCKVRKDLAKTDTYLLLMLNILVNILNKLLSNMEWRREKSRTTVEATVPLTTLIGSLFEHVVSGGRQGDIEDPSRGEMIFPTAQTDGKRLEKVAER